MTKLKKDTRRCAIRWGRDINSAESVRRVIDRYGGITEEQVEYLEGWFERNPDKFHKRWWSSVGDCPVLNIDRKKGNITYKIIDNYHDASITINNLKFEEAGGKL